MINKILLLISFLLIIYYFLIDISQQNENTQSFTTSIAYKNNEIKYKPMNHDQIIENNKISTRLTDVTLSQKKQLQQNSVKNNINPNQYKHTNTNNTNSKYSNFQSKEKKILKNNQTPNSQERFTNGTYYTSTSNYSSQIAVLSAQNDDSIKTKVKQLNTQNKQDKIAKTDSHQTKSVNNQSNTDSSETTTDTTVKQSRSFPPMPPAAIMKPTY